MNNNFNNPDHERWSLTRVSDTIAARNSWTLDDVQLQLAYVQ